MSLINASFPVSDALAHFPLSLIFAQDSLGITWSLHIPAFPLPRTLPPPTKKHIYALSLFRIVRRLTKEDYQIRKVMEGTVVMETIYLPLLEIKKELFVNSFQ